MSADRFTAGPCRVAEMEQLRALLNEVFITERNSSGDLFQFAPLLYSDENVENLRVIRKGKRIVGHAGILPRPIRWRGQVLQAGLIGGVCAREDLRGEGVGTLAMHDAAQRMAELSLDFGVLWTGSHEFYERVGWRSAGGIAVMSIQEAAGQVGGGHEIMALSESPLGPEDCHRLHIHAARNEVLRTHEETVTLMTVAHPETSIALEGGHLVGYAVNGGDTIREIEGPDHACISLLEHAASTGARRCVFLLNDPRMTLIKEALPVHLDRRPLGMILIANREGLVGKIAAETEMTAEELGIGAETGDEALIMKIFGTAEREPSDDALPLDIHIGYLDRV